MLFKKSYLEKDNNDAETTDISAITESIQKIAKGTILVFIGTLIALFFTLLSKILIVRYITQSEYGIYSLAIVILNIFVLISTLGLSEGATRQIAFYRGKNDKAKVKGVLLSSIYVSTVASVLFSVILFFASDFISTTFFHNLTLSHVLKIFSIAIPFFTLIDILTSIFRGFNKVGTKVYFQDILKSILFPALLLVVIYFGFSFNGVVFAFVTSILLTAIVFIFYTTKKLPTILKENIRVNASKMKKELLFFSIPLLTANMLESVITWTDTLLLGYFMMSDIVGLYNSAFPLASLLATALVSISFLYLPVMSQLYANGRVQELKKCYSILTKWVFSITLPIFSILFLFPEVVLRLLFTAQYVGAALALQILSLGFFIHTIFGPNGETILVMGKTRFLMWSMILTVITNIILNLILIPPLGIVGAAIATTFALTMKNILWAVKLYMFSRIHPFSKNYLKPMILSAFLVITTYSVVIRFFTITSLWHLLLAFLVITLISGLTLILTKSLEKEDITMLLTIEKKLKLNLKTSKRILKKFV
jgi:O-antigen/teichoic acid export membrane protein